MVSVDTPFVLESESFLLSIGANRTDAAKRFREVGVNRASADGVETLELTGSAEVVALDIKVQATQGEDERDEYGR